MRWRTVLFTPGTRPDRVRRAWEKGAADVVVMDLEDAVRPDAKADARRFAVSLLSDVRSAPAARAVRVNPLGSVHGGPDLDAVLPLMPDVLVVPKAEDPDLLRALGHRIEREGGATALLPIVETAHGVLRAEAIAGVPGVAAVAFGAEDLAASAGMRRTPGNDEVAVPRALVALAAAAAGVPAVDMVTADLKDGRRMRREALEARNLGYAGKMCLHPDQVRVVEEAFAPDPEELAWARKVVAAAEAAGAGAGGVVVVDGRMVDTPLVLQARRLLE